MAEQHISSQSTPSLHTSLMVQLARKITEETEKLDGYFKANGLPDLGFDVNAPGDLPKLPDDIQRSRTEISSATRQLERLVRGPRETVRWGIWSYLDTLSLQILNSYGIPNLVPLEEPIALDELQSKTKLDRINLARALRHAMTNNIFQEPAPGLIAHTAASKMLAQDANLQAWVGLNGDDFFPAGAHTLEALRADPEATSLTRTGFNHAWGTVDKEPMFATFGKDPPRGKRFAVAMASLTGGEGYEVRYFVDNYDFSDVNTNEGTLVDIGGSHGFVCVDLAKKWNKMKFVVQDLAKTISSAPEPICADEGVAQRICLQVHDFFTEQPVKGADVYYFRWILHNYSTPYAIKILKNLVPALKPGARVIINDHCLREPGAENYWDEKIMRSMDLLMLTLLNAQERTEKEFEELFKSADERFVFKGVRRPEGCRMSIIEAVWQP
ncbi:sterigmatocystin 7-O-methyltransferase precursor [Fusarium beomiforme]|uniref:Sterigmatocystin 7-O-methyltransferase n=1 Tax=Fusarium beomiforme TaxID=44412 RepID=A0A9P5ABM8_9HYPO|nr:sterigmatocystin 7-O-methyltransferase precursor [Fusarium beomiforme]